MLRMRAERCFKLASAAKGLAQFNMIVWPSMAFNAGISKNCEGWHILCQITEF